MNRPERLMSSYFAEFYEELAAIKQAANSGQLSLYLGGKSTGPDLAGSASARLLGIMAEQKQRVDTQANHVERRSYELARYFMAALADEVLGLNLNWKGRDYWHDFLIERQLFGRAVAGRDFYLLADQVLKSKGRNPIMEDLAAVALMSMQLGFEGQFEGASGKAKRDRYRQRLLHFIGIGKASGSRTQPLFPYAYRNLLAYTDDRRLAPFSRWYIIGAAMLGAYLVVSTLIWVANVQDLKTTLPYEGPFSLFNDTGGD